MADGKNGIRLKWSLVGAITAAVTVLGIVWSASASRTTTNLHVERNAAVIAEHTKSLEEHDKRLDTAEQYLQRIAANVEWLVDRAKSRP